VRTQRFLTDVLEEIGPRAVVDVFASYDVVLSELPAAEWPPPTNDGRLRDAAAILAGLVSFSGAVLRGSLVLSSSFGLVAQARPPLARATQLSAASAADWILARDWAGELANQVLGRMRNRLRLPGPVFITPPVVLSGAALTFALARGSRPRPHTFVARNPKVWFCMDALGDPGLKVSLEAESEGDEGRIIEFD
jgi:hypothetical protein